MFNELKVIALLLQAWIQWLETGDIIIKLVKEERVYNIHFKRWYNYKNTCNTRCTCL